MSKSEYASLYNTQATFSVPFLFCLSSLIGIVSIDAHGAEVNSVLLGSSWLRRMGWKDIYLRERVLLNIISRAFWLVDERWTLVVLFVLFLWTFDVSTLYLFCIYYLLYIYLLSIYPLSTLYQLHITAGIPSPK